MLDDLLDDKEGHESRHNDLRLVVRRTKLLFNDKECVVLNFEDISAIK